MAKPYTAGGGLSPSAADGMEKLVPDLKNTFCAAAAKVAAGKTRRKSVPG